MTRYSVKQVAELAGVSIRTLHHYDEIGLLKPAERKESGYRYYSREDLLKLQQILFYRELGFELRQIMDILEDPDYNLLNALEFQRAELRKKSGEIRTLIKTLDKTIVELKTGKKMKIEEMYSGFSKEEVGEIREEVIQKWGEDELLNSESRIGKLSKEEWQAVGQKGEQVGKDMAKLLHLVPADPKVQEVVKQHYSWLGNFYEVSKERYLGLADLYVGDERFTAYYDKYGKGTAQLLSEGMKVFASEKWG